jgi:lipoprotein-anchoring transpeptidase ErfK/SrfK
MRDYSEMVKRRLLILGALALSGIGITPVLEASALAPRARVTPLASIRVVGSGPIVWSSVSARAKPSFAAPVVRTLGQFRPDFYPRWVMAVDVKLDSEGQAKWYKLALPGRPNGRKGWVPAASVSIRPVDRWLVIYRGSRRFEFYEGGEIARSGRVAVGAPGMETPVGLFFVQSKFAPRLYPILGAFAFETSGYSKLSDWPGGGVVGVHGTDAPALIGQAVSHGCVRLDNRDILFLRSRVPLGTPVKIVAA